MRAEDKSKLQSSRVQFSRELNTLIERLSSLKLASNVPDRLQPLLEHLVGKVSKTLDKMEEKGTDFNIRGHDWCRENPEIAGTAHANVIVETYGATYAFSNKDPEANIKALNSGDLDMYLIFEDGKPVGTTCVVIQPNGWAELERSASLGAVGNRVIQDLRIIRWLTDENQAKKIFGVFSTCRTAPDRNIGVEQSPEIMRGGQANTHIWSQYPAVMVGGFGPLYTLHKKHGALEQFAYTFVTNREVFSPLEPQVFDSKDREFVQEWSSYYTKFLPKTIEEQDN